MSGLVRRVDGGRSRGVALVVCAIAALTLLLAFFGRFSVLRTRDDLWVVDRWNRHECTVGFEAILPPCSTALSRFAATVGFARPNGGDWAVSVPQLRTANVADATVGCRVVSLWYTDNARNFYLSDGHVYAVQTPSVLPANADIKVCSFPGRNALVALTSGASSTTAVMMR